MFAMNSKIASVVLLGVAFAIPAAGQLAAPNAAGVSLGHLHLYVSDVPAQQKFWATMGGVPVANQRLEMIQFPGVFILLRRGETKGGTVGSIVNHIGFVWKDHSMPVGLRQRCTLATPGHLPTQTQHCRQRISFK